MKTFLLIAIAFVFTILIFVITFSFFSREENLEIIENNITHDPDSTVFLSEDGGKEWRGLSDVRFSVTKLLFANSGSVVYAGTNGDGLWKSQNGGRSFSPITDSSNIIGTHATISDIELPSMKALEAYVAVFTDNKGRVISWKNESSMELYFSPVTRTTVSAIAIDPVDDRRLFFISGNGFFETRDAGSTWRAVHRFARTADRLLAHPRIAGIFWVTTARGELFYSTDYGVTWVNLSSRFRQFRLANENQHIFIDQSDRLYMISSEGLLLSVDAGMTWLAVPLIVDPDTLPLTAFAIHPNDDKRLYVAAEAQLYTSTDGGDSWQGKDFGGRRTIRSISIDPKNSDRILIGFDR